jgi:PHD/YefM family antitoxin component YafN of YafNO toxin-antitoxin module
MKIIKSAIVSNSDIIKNYKTQRELAEMHGKIYIFKNNQPDAVLFSINAFERVSEVLEAIENSDEEGAILALEQLIKNRKPESPVEQ